MRLQPILALILIALAGDAAAALARWGPTWSEVTGNRFPTARMHLEPAVISRIDGASQTSRIVKVEPGKHEVVVRSPMRKGFQGSDVKLNLDIEPCKRYYLNAQFKHSTGPDWEPVIAMVEPVSGCKLPSAQ